MKLLIPLYALKCLMLALLLYGAAPTTCSGAAVPCLQQAQAALKQATAHHDTSALQGAYYQGGQCLAGLNRPAAALRWYQAGMRLAPPEPDSSRLLNMYYYVSRQYYRQAGHHRDSAHAYLAQTATLARALNDSSRWLKTLHRQTNLMLQDGHWAGALKYALASVSLAEAYDDASLLGCSQHWLAIALGHTQQWPEAIGAYLAAIAAFEAGADMRRLHRARRDLAHAYYSTGRLADALELLEGCVVYFQANGHIALYVRSLSLMAMIYEEIGAHASAVSLYQSLLPQVVADSMAYARTLSNKLLAK